MAIDAKKRKKRRTDVVEEVYVDHMATALFRDYMESYGLYMHTPYFVNIANDDINNLVKTLKTVRNSRKVGLPEEFNVADYMRNEGIPVRESVNRVPSLRRRRLELAGDNERFARMYISQRIAEMTEQSKNEQRTMEWYNHRHHMITASTAWKLLDTQASFNSLVAEKSAPFEMKNQDRQMLNSAMHHGNMYEPLSVLYYENKYKTKVGLFGLIRHAEHDFIGASPDGVNVDETNAELYGRMLEIKNIVNRDITGVPKKEYWVQMQQQMEVCDLDECDFLETRFVEYASYSEYMLDTSGDNVALSREGRHKGVFMCIWDERLDKYVYEYPEKFIMTNEEYEVWNEKVMNDLPSWRRWTRNHYWRLDEVSCVLVERNKWWFARALPLLRKGYDTILEESANMEYLKRVPKKVERPPRGKMVVEKLTEDDYLKAVMTKNKPTVETILIDMTSYDSENKPAVDMTSCDLENKPAVDMTSCDLENKNVVNEIMVRKTKTDGVEKKPRAPRKKREVKPKKSEAVDMVSSQDVPTDMVTDDGLVCSVNEMAIDVANKMEEDIDHAIDKMEEDVKRIDEEVKVIEEEVKKMEEDVQVVQVVPHSMISPVIRKRERKASSPFKQNMNLIIKTEKIGNIERSRAFLRENGFPEDIIRVGK